MATFEIARRYAEAMTPGAKTSGRATHVLDRVPKRLRAARREWLGFVPIYNDGTIGSLVVVGEGDDRTVSVSVRELTAAILARRPEGIVLVHNHPSGNLRASAADRALTRRVSALGGELGITLHGHWIVGTTGQRSV